MVIHMLLAAVLATTAFDGSDKAMLRARADNVASNFKTLGNADRRVKVREALIYEGGDGLSPEDLEFVVDTAHVACKRYDKVVIPAHVPASPPSKSWYNMNLNGYVVPILGYYGGGQFIWNPAEQPVTVQQIYYGVPAAPQFFYQATPGCPGGRCSIR